MIMVTCPCCDGAKRLTVVEHDEENSRTILSKPECTHCEGKGEVPAEDTETQESLPIETPVSDILAAYSTPGLRRGEVTRREKREHLLALRVAPEDADKILAELYGATP